MQLAILQDDMEKGALSKTEERDPKQESCSSATLADALAMLGLQHAHVIHEADPDTKVARLIVPYLKST